MSREQRCILAQFRSGTLALKIETGRWQNLPIPERVCSASVEDAVEDEFHFLCIFGNKYKDIRESLYNKAARPVGIYHLRLYQMKINLCIL